MPTPSTIVQSYFKQKTTRSEGYKKFIRSQRCLVCGSVDSQHHHEPLNGRGIGLKGPDDEALPLCHKCHTERHQKGRKSFYSEHRINWYLAVIKYQKLYGATHGNL